MSSSPSFSSADREYMALAIQCAKRGVYTVTPNPAVGCVLVRDGKIVGQGWHQSAGQAHAEVNALKEAGSEAKGATAYVTLEPCNHIGRTGACCEALISAGVSRVVSAMQDPNPQVAGAGHARLAEAGLLVASGLLASEAAALNLGFIKRMQHQLPYVTCKMAMSLDGRAAMASGESQWITGSPARQKVQQLRAASCVIVTGIGTVLQDDPALNVRHIDSLNSGADEAILLQPDLLIIDSSLRTPVTARVLAQESLASRRVFVACAESADIERQKVLQALGVRVVSLPDNSNSTTVNLLSVLRFLAQQEMNHVFVEAGPTLAGQFIDQALPDQLKIFVAPKLMGSEAQPVFKLPIATMSSAIGLTIDDVSAVGDDWLFSCSLSSS